MVRQHAFDSLGSTLGPCEYQRNVRISVRGKPFVAVEPPHSVLVAGNRFKRADIRAAGALGHELRALPEIRQFGRQHFRHQVILQFLAAVGLEDVDGRVGDAERTHHAELGLDKKVLEGVLHGLRGGTLPAVGAGLVAHRVQLEILEADFFHVSVRGVVNDGVKVASETVARRQRRRVAVHQTGQGIELVAGNSAQLSQHRLEVCERRRIHVDAQRRLKAAVNRVKIQAGAIRRNMPIVGLGRLGVEPAFGASCQVNLSSVI